jgi:hypothetical protein
MLLIFYQKKAERSGLNAAFIASPEHEIFVMFGLRPQAALSPQPSSSEGRASGRA